MNNTSMNIISIGLDAKTLDKESVVAIRNRAYGEIVDSYSIVVPAKETQVVALSNSAIVYGVGGSNKLVQLFGVFTTARRLIKEGKCDVITTQDTYYLGLIGVILSSLYHVGLEVQVLGIEKLNIVRKLLTQFVLKRAGSIRVLSPRLQTRLVQEFGVKEERMRQVPIYVDVSTLGFNAESLSLEQKQELEVQTANFKNAYQGRFNIVSVNRLVPIKNISMQLSAIEKLCLEFPHILLHVVGDGPLEKQLTEEILKRGIQNNVILHGFKSGVTLNPFFTESDCFVLTSDFEGYGMVIIEASTAGLPIVMTDVGCAGEVIINEKSGIIVPAKNTEAFTSALRRIITDDVLRKKLSEEAKHAIAQLPSFDTVLEKYKASWSQALANKR